MGNVIHCQCPLSSWALSYLFPLYSRWPMLTNVDQCWPMLTSADQMLTNADKCRPNANQCWPMLTSVNQGSMASSGSYQRPRSQISNPRPIMSNCKETQQTSANSRHSSKALNSNSKPSSKAPNSSSKPSSKALNSSSSRPPSRAQCDQASCDMWTVISLWSRKINHNVFVDMTLSIYCRNTPLCKQYVIT